MNDATNDNMSIVVIESPLSSSSYSSSIALILILSILCFFGIVFMIFGPMMRSEAMKRVDNYIFGRSSKYGNPVIDGVQHL